MQYYSDVCFRLNVLVVSFFNNSFTIQLQFDRALLIKFRSALLKPGNP